MREAISAYDRAADLAPLSLRAASSSAFGRTYLADCTPEEVLEAHRAYARRLPRPPVPAAVRRTPERLRIGYVSADFRRHSVAYFVEPVLAHHDRGAFEIRCYYNHRKADDVTARLLALSDGWVDCADLSDDELEARIRADRIDILVDLSGHTSGNRLTVFARRPAPVQGIWLGYPTTTGLDAIDFRVSDWCVDPEGEERASVERVARLEDSYFCFGAPRIAARLGPPPMSRTGEPVFGSFNNLAKASGDALALWKRVLDSVSGSRLMLKSKGLADEKSRADFCERLEGAGISRERVILSGWKESTGAHLAAYDEVDIGLDTTPYNGATTTCEALWMGVPVVTLRGRTHASRMGASILAAAGLDELVARTGDDYVRIAVELAKEPQRVSSLRVGLRERLTASRLMDAPRFVAGLERAFRQVWQESGQ
jgi:predicted O-linked N-acetylglucosamine transferase (SPINDLY family)